MDRNPNDSFDRSQTGLGTGSTGASPGTNVLHESGSADQGNVQSAGAFAGGAGTASGDIASSGSQGTAQRGADAVKDRLGRVREKATHFKSTLADRLESGADRLRQRAQAGPVQRPLGVADSADTGTETGAQGREAMQKVGGAVANGMQSTAQWLRTADMQSMRDGVETQVRTNPGRSLLVALGLGYVIGRIFRGGQGGGHGRQS